MSASVGAVVAQLRAVVDATDRAAMSAHRARVDADTSSRRFAGAGRGSSNLNMRQAIAESAAAVERLSTVAVMLAEAANAFADYINHIAPGTVPTREASTGPPTGTELLSARGRRGKARHLFEETVRSGGDVSDGGKEVTSAVVRAVQGIRGGGGTVATSTASGGVVARQAPQPAVSAPDIVAGLVALAVATIEGSRQALGRLKRRTKEESDGNGP